MDDSKAAGAVIDIFMMSARYRPGTFIGQRTKKEIVTWSVVAVAHQNSDHNVQLLLASSCIGARDSMI